MSETQYEKDKTEKERNEKQKHKRTLSDALITPRPKEVKRVCADDMRPRFLSEEFKQQSEKQAQRTTTIRERYKTKKKWTDTMKQTCEMMTRNSTVDSDEEDQGTSNNNTEDEIPPDIVGQINETEEAILKQCKEPGRRKLMIEVIRSRLEKEKENEDIPDDLQSVITSTEKRLLRRLEGTERTEALVVIRERIETDKLKEAAEGRMREFRERYPSCKTDESENEEEGPTTSTKQRKQRTDARKEQQNEEQRENGMQDNAQVWVKKEIQTAYDNLTGTMNDKMEELFREQRKTNKKSDLQRQFRAQENRETTQEDYNDEHIRSRIGKGIAELQPGHEWDKRRCMTESDYKKMMEALRQMRKTFNIHDFKGEPNEEPDLYSYT